MGAYITPAIFLVDLPEFAPPQGAAPAQNLFPQSSIAYWINIAYQLLDPCRWGTDGQGTLLALGVEMFVAHHVALEAMNMRDAQVGAIPGLTKGAIAAKSAGDVSVNYDTNAVIEKDAGHWNYTNYGLRLKHLMNLVGAGPVHIGPCGGFGGAWAGPITGFQ